MKLFIISTMLFALSAGLILPNQENIRSRRSLIGGIIGGSGNGNVGGGIGGGIGGIVGGVGGIIGGVGDIVGGIAGILKSLGDITGGLAGNIKDISGNIGAIAEGGLTINIQAQLSVSLTAVNSQLDNTVKLINQLPASLTQAQVAKVNDVVAVLIKLRLTLVDARQQVNNVSADKNNELIVQINLLIQKIDVTIKTIKTKVPSANVPVIGAGGSDSGSSSSGGNDDGSSDNGTGEDNSLIHEIATAVKAILRGAKGVSSGTATAEEKAQLVAAINTLEVHLNHVSDLANQINTPVTPSEAARIQVGLKMVAKLRLALAMSHQKLSNSASASANADVIASIQGLIQKLDGISATLSDKILPVGGSGSGTGSDGGISGGIIGGIGGGIDIGGIIGGAGSTDEDNSLIHEIATAVKAILQGANDVSSGTASAEAKAQLVAAINTLEVRLNQVSDLANQINTPVTSSEAARMKVGVKIVDKVGLALELTNQKLSNSASASANADIIASIQGLIQTAGGISATLSGKLSSSSSGSGSGGSSSGSDGNISGGIIGGIGGGIDGSIDIGGIIGGGIDGGIDIGGIIGGNPSSNNEIIQSIAVTIKEVLANANDVTTGGSGSADARLKLSNALNALNALLDKIQNHAQQISTPISPADAARVEVAISLLKKIRAVLVATKAKLSSTGAAGENAELILSIEALITKLDDTDLILTNKLNNDNGNNGEEVSTIEKITVTLREILVTSKLIAAGKATENDKQQLTTSLANLDAILVVISNKVDEISSPPSPADALKVKLLTILLLKIKGALTLSGKILITAPNAGENVDVIAALSNAINKVNKIEATLASKSNGETPVDAGNSDDKNEVCICGNTPLTEAINAAYLLTKVSTLTQQLPSHLNILQVGQVQTAVIALSSVRATLVDQLEKSIGSKQGENTIKLVGGLIGQIDATLATLKAKVPSGSLGISTLPQTITILGIPNVLQETVNTLSSIKKQSALIR
ncbi:uncharacterized protein LOC122852566 [Aphidius gifuensis]|uniref:uncharacterized protein LOC122852566 n=1 Tax=Aphidius gifuensis TaxID=684658 RepID=UPI001CDC28E6|nr:uncharacterized protein LOC122852566 [Aphidius gifuensis]